MPTAPPSSPVSSGHVPDNAKAKPRQAGTSQRSAHAAAQHKDARGRCRAAGRGGSGRSEPAGAPATAEAASATDERARRGNTSRYRKAGGGVMLSRVDGRAVLWPSGDVPVLPVDLLL
jgi:hypothetical protein